jgi:D-3-phosphoglycerate dehydrogenase
MAPTPKVYVLDPYHPDAVAKLTAAPGIHVTLPADPAKAQWKTDATALMLRSDTRITSSDLSAAKSLKVIVKQGVGVDNIDLDAAKAQGVIVCNTPALNSEAVAELTISLALAVSRRVCEIDRLVRSGQRVVRSQTLGKSLFHKKIGLIGMGNIGRIVAKKWMSAMEGQIVAFDPYAPADAWHDLPHLRVRDLGELLGQVDVLSLHVPLTAATRGMIGREELKLMKKDAILLNCSRGGIVDEAALLEALKNDEIFGAALDAMDVEPPTVETYGEGLLSLPNIIMTPHIGASTVENQSQSGIAVVDTLLAVLAGQEVPNRLV